MMKRPGTLTRILAIAGTALAWFPILAPITITVVYFIDTGTLRFDYLMPAELFLATLIGGGLLIWAGLRARSDLRLIGWGLGLAFGLLVGSQTFAVVTGLASGDTEPAGLLWAIILAMLVCYSLAIIAVAIGGVMLLREIYRPPQGG